MELVYTYLLLQYSNDFENCYLGDFVIKEPGCSSAMPMSQR